LDLLCRNESYAVLCVHVRLCASANDCHLAFVLYAGGAVTRGALRCTRGRRLTSALEPLHSKTSLLLPVLRLIGNIPNLGKSLTSFNIEASP
jgi:hypothetical protein